MFNPTSPLVTIAIPFYNPGPYFASALRSVFAQSFSNWELLLLDDGGGDGALTLARALADRRVRVISDGVNAGLAARLNQAASLACGRYLFRMDADDIMHPQRVERQVALLETCGPNTVVGSAAYSMDAASRVVGLRPVLQPAGEGFALRHSFHHPTVAAHTEWFLRHPYSQQPAFRRCEDAELWCRSASCSDFRWTEQPLLFYRELGVFNLKNYMSTGEGLLELIRIHESGTRRYARLRRKQQSKLALAWSLRYLGLSSLLVRRRFEPLSPSQRAQADQALYTALSCPLPMAAQIVVPEDQPCFV